jgi:hypothetical protein
MLFAEGTEATGTKTEGEKGIKVHLKARSRNAISHWCFGTVAHDFSTLSMPAKIALDDSHGNEIGHGRPTMTTWGLEIDGVVLPDPRSPDSERIAYNLENAIPQQASIDFCGDYDVLEIPEGLSYPVNGQTLPGPACVIQNWSLRACAICKEGADPNTETVAQFAEGETAKAPRKITTLTAQDFILSAVNENTQPANKEQQMAEQTQTPAKVEEAQAETVKAEDTAKPEQLQAEAPKAEEAKIGQAEAEAPKVEELKANAKPEELQAKVAELEAKLKDVETKLSVAKVGTKPLASESGSVQTREQLWSEYAKLNPKQKALFYAANRASMKSN